MFMVMLFLTWMEKITGLVDDWLRRHLLIAHHFVSESKDVTYMEFDRTATYYSGHEKRLHNCWVCVGFFFNVWAAVNEGVVMFTMDILLSGWCLASHYLCTCVAAGGLSWFTNSLLWLYFCMETVLNAVFIGIFLFSWEIFSLISLKGRKKHLWLPVWWHCAKWKVSSAVLFYSCLKRIFFCLWFDLQNME